MKVSDKKQSNWLGKLMDCYLFSVINNYKSYSHYLETWKGRYHVLCVFIFYYYLYEEGILGLFVVKKPRMVKINV